jgi:hypothetical protein
MAFAKDGSYAVPIGDLPLSSSRIAHARNWHAGGAVTVSDTADGYFADAPNNSLTYERWKAATLPAEWEVDFGGAVEADYCVIAGHDLGSKGATVNVEYWDGSGWNSILSMPLVVVDDRPIFVIFDRQSWQAWRIKVYGVDAPEIAVVRFGVALQMPVPAVYQSTTPLHMRRSVVMRTNNSVTGEWLGRSKIRGALSGEFSWREFPEAFGLGALDTFLRAVEDEPFVIAWRPDLRPDEVAFCQVSGSALPVPVGSGSQDLMNFAMSVTAYADR